jgi:hypothetical protein
VDVRRRRAGDADPDTSIAKMARRYLSPGSAMDGAHARLRELARDYR